MARQTHWCLVQNAPALFDYCQIKTTRSTTFLSDFSSNYVSFEWPIESEFISVMQNEMSNSHCVFVIEIVEHLAGLKNCWNEKMQ